MRKHFEKDALAATPSHMAHSQKSIVAVEKARRCRNHLPQLKSLPSKQAARLCTSKPAHASSSKGICSRLQRYSAAKRLHHQVLDNIELGYSGFAVDGRPDLGMIVYNPVDRSVADRIRELATD